MSRMQDRKDYPISMRLPEADVAMIDRAAALKGRSRTDFVRDAAVRAAEEAVMEQQLVRMTEDGFADFMALMAAPSRWCPNWLRSCAACPLGSGLPSEGLSMALSAPEPLNDGHDLGGFSCGKPALDHWLKTRARANQESGFTVVIVVHDAGRVVGYYGLSPTAVLPASLPRSVRTGQPPNPSRASCSGSLPSISPMPGMGSGRV